jgi:hypothetical protein
MPRDVTVKVYKFNELSEKAREKALEKLSDINTDYDWWNQDGLLDLTQAEYDDIREKPTPGNVLISYDSDKINFDLNWNNRYLQFNDIVVNDQETFRKYLQIPKRLWAKVDYGFTNDREESTQLYFEPQEDIGEADEQTLQNAQKIFTGKVKEALHALQEQYDYLQTDEAIIETIEANDYDFNEDGTLF